jgi:hypothetical protein
MRGINSFQLFNDGKRWWILSVYWQHESAEYAIPQKYLYAQSSELQFGPRFKSVRRA